MIYLHNSVKVGLYIYRFSIIDKMLKQRRDSIDAFKKANRNDLVEKEEFEVKVLQEYMPKQLSDQELEEFIIDAIKVSGANSMKDMGSIMNILKSTLSADHRVLDGAVAAKLLNDFNDIIENPFDLWLQSKDMEVI